MVSSDDVNGKCSDDDFSRSLNDVTDQLKHLLSPKWIVDDDTYNLDAFDQCEGAWPIAHPLPLPLWSNNPKKPFDVENVCRLYSGFPYSNCWPNIELIFRFRFGNTRI